MHFYLSNDQYCATKFCIMKVLINLPINQKKIILFKEGVRKREIITSQNLAFLAFRFFPCLHYFVNIPAIFYSNIKFLYNFQQPTKWAVRKCHQPFLKMLQGLRNKQKTIKPFFWNTLYLRCNLGATKMQLRCNIDVI